jgi:hypothetical protein
MPEYTVLSKKSKLLKARGPATGSAEGPAGMLTRKQRRALGQKNTCDICGAKAGTGRGRNIVVIWSFTVKGAKGRIFNRCKKHLSAPVRRARRSR